MENAKEIWKKIPGYGGVFYISDKGRVYRHGDKKKDRMVKAYFGQGLMRVKLSYASRIVDRTIPRLLDETFGLDGEGTFFEYKDGDPTNVSLENVSRVRCNWKPDRKQAERTNVEKSYNCVLTIGDVDTYYNVENEYELEQRTSDLGIDWRAIKYSFENPGKANIYWLNNKTYTLLVCPLRRGVKR